MKEVIIPCIKGIYVLILYFIGSLLGIIIGFIIGRFAKRSKNE